MYNTCMFNLVALGNPGQKYQLTRHNVGFLALSFFAKKNDLPQGRKSAKYLGEVAEGVVAGNEVRLLYPDTYMNNSGQAVKKITTVSPVDSLIVLYDDVALPFGEVRISFGRGDGGHNGIKSIIEALGTKDFVRVRIGVGASSFWTGKLKVLTGDQLAKFVLSSFSKSEQEKLEKDIFPRVQEVLLAIMTGGYEKAMNQFN